MFRRRDPERERFVCAGVVSRRGHRHLQEHQGGHRQDHRCQEGQQQQQQQQQEVIYRRYAKGLQRLNRNFTPELPC